MTSSPALDDAATAELYAGVLRLARRIVGEDAAQDVAQETFLRLLASSPPSSPRSWLATVARNLSIDEVRRRRRGVPVATVPETTVEAADVAELTVIRSAVNGLPERYRLVLWLKEVEGRTARDIAGLLGTTQAAVELTLFRARRALRERYEAQNRTLPALLLFPVDALRRAAGAAWRLPPELAAEAARWVAVGGVVASMAVAPTVAGSRTVGETGGPAATSVGALGASRTVDMGADPAAAGAATASEDAEGVVEEVLVAELDRVILAADALLTGAVYPERLKSARDEVVIAVDELIAGAVPDTGRVDVRLPDGWPWRLQRGTPVLAALQGDEPMSATAMFKVDRDGSLRMLDGRKTRLTVADVRRRAAALRGPKQERREPEREESSSRDPLGSAKSVAGGSAASLLPARRLP